MTEPLLAETDGAVRILSLNDAPMNRMSLEFMDALEAEVNAIAEDDGIRAVVLTSAGDRNFSVGMDLKQLPQGIERLGSAEAVFEQRLRIIRNIETMGKPWVVTLFGYCLGGGLEIPLGCHFRLTAEEDAQIGLPELDLGAMPAWGGSARLTKTVGEAHALDMILRAKKISGPEAWRIGLVHEVWPLAELKDAARNLGQELAAAPAAAVRAMMGVIIDGEDKPLEDLINAEQAAVKANRGSPDSAEGMRAFMEKRKPVFNQH
ncbi:MAG: crotonase [Gammaproteobacteria bacterium]|nr:crotonase [Gammaproteobacteria bacterium]|tara:strand:- start:46 stop:831 length:786 start_codon:yes stop_codon:yes gene_type:complete